MLDAKINYNNILCTIHEALKLKQCNYLPNFDIDTVDNSSKNIGYLNNKQVNRIIFYSRSHGCEWSCQKFGGCFMCDHYFRTTKGVSLPKNSYYNQFII